MQRLGTVMLSSLLVIVFAVPATAATHTVNQTGTTFDPADLTIAVGDEVQWVWSGGSHTVTSGTGLSDPQAGDLFDASLTSGSTTFSFTFDTAGDHPYFCRPHVGLGMTGVVHVEPSVSTEESTWGQLKVLFR